VKLSPNLGTILVIVAAISVGMFAWTSVDVRAIGRTDPKRAATHKLPWGNFSETYSDGSAVGLMVGSSKREAIGAADAGGFIVQPSCWGDSRAGGASLYETSELRKMMLRQPVLCFEEAHDLRKGLIVRFHRDRVASIEVYYINSESL